ncbi:ATP-dependent zinc protease family protein [Kordiimonas aestuarii]|uniref:ATP-dependent zinc protease family protein n=1 Tax=Kordiimonas aestuarii TaxID=1005925 RepID=UPI0021D3CACE|nr:RimK/LysX family protein [Kordiimonas aestuarii]
MKSKLIIGWREWAVLPDFAVPEIKAKIDTGAKTSALHAYRIKKIMRDGVPWAEFFVHPVQRRKRPEVKCAAPIVGEREVKSSNGIVQTRLVVSTILELGPFAQKIELTLTNRDEMGFRLLIGRQALTRRYLVDSGLSYGLGEPEAQL